MHIVFCNRGRLSRKANARVCVPKVRQARTKTRKNEFQLKKCNSPPLLCMYISSLIAKSSVLCTTVKNVHFIISTYENKEVLTWSWITILILVNWPHRLQRILYLFLQILNTINFLFLISWNYATLWIFVFCKLSRFF